MGDFLKDIFAMIIIFTTRQIAKVEHSVSKSPKMSHKTCFQKKKLAKLDNLGIFNQLLYTQNVNVARFARIVVRDFFGVFIHNAFFRIF